MHPDVRANRAGACPRCGMALRQVIQDEDAHYLLAVTTVPATVRAGAALALQLQIVDARTEAPVQRFAEVHEKLLHLFVVGDDLRHFEHIHPSLVGDGVFAISITLPRPGRYQLIADFLPEGGLPQVIQRALVTAGYDDMLRVARLQPNRSDNNTWQVALDGRRRAEI